MKRLPDLHFPRFAAIAFVVLSAWGVLLRCLQLFDLPLNYQFILHAHSHFAFSGWMFFSIALLVARQVSGVELTTGIKWVLLLALASAYGMLLGFSWQGYQAMSISFSTLFVIVTYRFTYLILKGGYLENKVNTIARVFIRGSLFFLCLSSLGPFALGPLAAMGLKQTPFYTDAVYGYLHFQLNGFMLLAALGLLAAALPFKPAMGRAGFWLKCFIISTVLLYFMFTLWGKPGTLCWALAVAGSGLNLVSWLVLCFAFKQNFQSLSVLEKAALLALTLKCVFQVLICIPAVGDWAFLSRNLIIGYIHLLTLGIIMPLLLGRFFAAGLFFSRIGEIRFSRIYLVLVIVYLTLLFLQPLLALFAMAVPALQSLLLLFSLGLFAAGLLLRTK